MYVTLAMQVTITADSMLLLWTISPQPAFLGVCRTPGQYFIPNSPYKHAVLPSGEWSRAVDMAFGVEGSGRCEVAKISLTILITNAGEVAPILFRDSNSNPYTLDFLAAVYDGAFERAIARQHASSAALAELMRNHSNNVTVPGARFTGVRVQLLVAVCAVLLACSFTPCLDSSTCCKVLCSTWKLHCTRAPNNAATAIRSTDRRHRRLIGIYIGNCCNSPYGASILPPPLTNKRAAHALASRAVCV
jgi:hypothetical protein